MFGSARSGLSAYAKVGLETGVDAATPHQLIVMLFDGAITTLVKATREMKSGNIAAKGEAISKAIMIIEGGLRASLNKKVGGEIALNLDALYQYMSNRLLHANLHNDVELIEEVRRLLIDLKGAWEKIPVVQAMVEADVQNAAQAGFATQAATSSAHASSHSVSLGS
jgi:flagellar protein FliS